MKITITISFLFLFFCLCNTSKNKNATEHDPKNGNKEIRRLLDQYIDYTIKENYEALVDFIYPEALSKYSKEETIDDIRNGLHNENYDIVVNHIYTDTISDVIVKGANKYTISKNRTDATFMIRGGILNDSQVQSNMYDQFCTDFKGKYGEENVKCNDNSKGVSVILKSTAYFIYSNKDNKWYMIGDSDPKNVEKYIPEEIRTVKL